jgi:hypothetical protein
LSPHRNSIASKILAARRGHFVGRRQIAPELQDVNSDAFGRDFIVDQSAASGHPLHVAWQNRAFMPLIAVIIDAALDDIGHGLDPTMRVPAENTAREPILISAKSGSVAAKSPRIPAGVSGLTRCCGVISC